MPRSTRIMIDVRVSWDTCLCLTVKIFCNFGPEFVRQSHAPRILTSSSACLDFSFLPHTSGLLWFVKTSSQTCQSPYIHHRNRLKASPLTLKRLECVAASSISALSKSVSGLHFCGHVTVPTHSPSDMRQISRAHNQTPQVPFRTPDLVQIALQEGHGKASKTRGCIIVPILLHTIRTLHPDEMLLQELQVRRTCGRSDCPVIYVPKLHVLSDSLP